MSPAEEARQDLAVFENAMLHARTEYERMHAGRLHLREEPYRGSR